MKPITQLILILLLIFMVVPNNADALTGNELLAYCEEGEDGKLSSNFQANAYCHGFITGAIAGIMYLDTQFRFCIPDGATHKQTKDIVFKYLKENPQRLHENYVELLLLAMKEAFPCKPDFPE